MYKNGIFMLGVLEFSFEIKMAFLSEEPAEMAWRKCGGLG